MKILVVLLAVALSAFAQKITVEFDAAVDFTKFKTFAIRARQLNSRNPALNSELIKKRIHADLERALSARGLILLTGESPLNVRYPFGTAPKTAIESYPAGWR